MATTIKEALYTYLTTQSLITDQVSLRIFPHNAPNSAKTPYITFERTDHESIHHMGGASKLAKADFDISVWGSTVLEAKTVAEVLREELDGFQTALMSTIDVRSVVIGGQNDDIEYIDDDSEVPLYLIEISIEIFHFRTVPTF